MIEQTQDVGDRGELADPERRAALAKMGKFAGVTAPAVVALLTADASSAWAASGKGGHPGRPRPRGPIGRIISIIFG